MVDDETWARYEAAGLYDPAADGAAERRELLEFFAARDVGVEQVRHSADEGRIAAAAADAPLAPGPSSISIRDVATRLGTDIEAVARVWRASGFAPVDVDCKFLRPSDAEVFAVFLSGEELLGAEATLELTRVLGGALARIAESAIALFLRQVEAPFEDTHPTERQQAEATESSVQTVLSLQPVIDGLFRHHLREAILRFRIAETDKRTGTAHLAIGFVDLVGFTPISAALDAPELSALIADFEARSQDAVTQFGGRLVKLIGDEIMYVALDARSAVEIALTLVREFDTVENVTPRGGVASGDVLVRSGDYYGSVVNLASRVADLAIPDEILTTDAVRIEAESLAVPAAFVPAGRRVLKGFVEPVQLFSAQEEHRA